MNKITPGRTYVNNQGELIRILKDTVHGATPYVGERVKSEILGAAKLTMYREDGSYGNAKEHPESLILNSDTDNMCAHCDNPILYINTQNGKARLFCSEFSIGCGVNRGEVGICDVSNARFLTCSEFVSKGNY